MVGLALGSGCGSFPGTDNRVAENEDLARRGIRVGFACRELDVLPPENSDEATEQGLIWLGLVGMLDAPRPEVRSAVARCRQLASVQ